MGFRGDEMPVLYYQLVSTALKWPKIKKNPTAGLKVCHVKVKQWMDAYKSMKCEEFPERDAGQFD